MDIQWLGPYQIIGKLGRGGMGTVYQAQHRESGDRAAVKLLAANLAQEEGFRNRFEGEIEALKKLNHPNIVRLLGFGETGDGHLFYAMELVDGSSLEGELQRGRHFDWRQVVHIGIETCLALKHAHDRGIIHRDLKPGNLLLSSDGRVKLADFGIARLFGNTRLTGAGIVVGTAEYMAPEQAEGVPVDYRADLYSLGALLYALLARRPVFRGKSLPEVLHKQRFELPEPVRKYAPDVPEELEQILAQLLEKEPQRRIPNADVLGRRLDELLETLAAGSETVEALSGWYLRSDSATDDQPAATADGSGQCIAGTQGLELPITQALSEAKRQESVATDLLPAAAQPASHHSTASTAGSTSRGHFVAVAPHELDQAVPEEPPPSTYLQTGILVAALLAMGAVAWWFLQPASADALYSRIEARMESAESPSDIREVRSQINDLLGQYPKDDRAAKVRLWDKQLDLRLARWNFAHRKSTDLGSPIEQLYDEAIRDARTDPTRAMSKLRALLDLYDRPGETGEAALCLEMAKSALEELRKKVDKRASEELALLRSRLDTADSQRESEPALAEKAYRAVIELYGDKPWAADDVRRARAALEAKSDWPQPKSPAPQAPPDTPEAQPASPPAPPASPQPGSTDS